MCNQALNQNFANFAISSLSQQTPLQIAVREGNEDTVKCLVSNMADISITDNEQVSDFVKLVVDK